VTRKFLITLTGLLGAGLFVWGNWINFKAVAASFLLEQVWTESLETGLPASPWSSMDARLFAKLSVPKHDVQQIVLDRSSGQALAFAPTFIETTDRPGQGGTTAIAAHKNTHFGFLEKLKPGDVVTLQSVTGKQHSYEVETSFIVDTREQDLTISDETKQLLLVTCYPFDALSFNGPLRYVVRARATS